MLNKCANPDCPEQFRSLRQGRLFVMDTAPQPILEMTVAVRRKPERLEYFWLCHRCCKSQRIIADANHRIIVALI